MFIVHFVLSFNWFYSTAGTHERVILKIREQGVCLLFLAFEVSLSHFDVIFLNAASFVNE